MLFLSDKILSFPVIQKRVGQVLFIASADRDRAVKMIKKNSLFLYHPYVCQVDRKGTMNPGEPVAIYRVQYVAERRTHLIRLVFKPYHDHMADALKQNDVLQKDPHLATLGIYDDRRAPVVQFFLNFAHCILKRLMRHRLNQKSERLASKAFLHI